MRKNPLKMSKNLFFEIYHMFGMPVFNRKMQEQLVLFSNIILQYKTCQINLTARKLSKNNYPNKLHTVLTNIDFSPRPSPNVPYVYCLMCSETLEHSQNMNLRLYSH